MAAIAKFTCPDDGKEFNAMWTHDKPVTCPHCKKVWPTEVITNEDGRLIEVRILEESPE